MPAQTGWSHTSNLPRSTTSCLVLVMACVRNKLLSALLLSSRDRAHPRTRESKWASHLAISPVSSEYSKSNFSLDSLFSQRWLSHTSDYTSPISSGGRHVYVW